MKTFSIGAIYKEATAIMKPERWGKIWQFWLISLVFSIALYVLLGKGALIGGFIVTFIVTVWSLSFVTKGSFSYDDVFASFTLKDFSYFICALLLVGLAVLGGLILLIIPGIVVMVRLFFVQFVTVEKKLTPRQSLKESIRITKGARWKIFWFIIVSLLINLLGLICLVVGLLYTVPLTQLAKAILYKKLSEQSAE